MPCDVVEPWIEVSRSALLANLRQLRGRVPAAVRFAAVLKANAWGHGRDLVASVLADQVELLAAAEPTDALALAGAAPGRTLCLGPAYGRQLRELCAAGVQVAVADRRALPDLRPGAGVHLLVDTGLHRLGCRPAEVGELIQALRARGARVEGVYCHVAGADRADWLAVQAEVATLRRSASAGTLIHCGGSSLLIERPDLVGDLARPGIAMYGHLPHPRQAGLVSLTPALRLLAPVLAICELQRGDRIGYLGQVLGARTTVATLGVGVAHGLDPALARVGAQVLVGGRHCPILCDPMLDYTLVDVTAAPTTSRGDHALVIGGADGTPTSVSTLAGQLDQTPERLLIRLASTVTRRIGD